MRIKIGKQHESDVVFDGLKAIFAKYSGPAVVFLHLVDKRRVIKAEQKYWLDPSPEAILEIETLLGKGTVQIV
ncbi:hypothetical protein SDC9_128794 [bioreactor metagenome]|uniref:Uncharacterized protein n=1 Tax=bioreactor metagenome TaxID=1076179 RepID=A0A645CXW4_9ZZZZ